MLTLDDLIRKGYFSDDLVPAFNTQSFANIIGNITVNDFSKRSSKYCSHTIPKVKHQRRVRGIPNPLHQLRLSNTIVSNWNNLYSAATTSSITLSKPILGGSRALSKENSFRELRESCAYVSTDSRYLLRTDISRFYPTIYTHSIPWALHGKETAKRLRRPNQLLGNQIDFDVRNTQDGQTIGIPQGPDTSFLIGEVIGNKLDELMMGGDTTSVRGYRYVDDYYLYFKTYHEAEFALSRFHSILKEYELEVNPNKTEIVQLPEMLESLWVSDLRLYQFRNSVQAQRSDLISYFSKAYDYSKKFPDESVLKYAVKAIQQLTVYPDNWNLYESLILRSIIAEPSILPKATEILFTYHRLGYPMNYNKIQDTITEVIVHHCQFNHAHEISWALWLSRTLGLDVSEVAAQRISLLDSCLISLITLDLRDQGYIPNGLDVSKWGELMRTDNLYQEYWLLAYEALVKGWLRPVSGRDYVANDDFFSVLQANNVQFYDISLEVEEIELIEQDIDIRGNFMRVEGY